MTSNDKHHYQSSEQTILQTIAAIPYGKVCTYGEIAKLSGNQGKARYVGFILKNLPNTSSIPWHRVINSQGKSSFPINSERYLLQIKLLEQESIQVKNNKISLKKYLW